MAIEKHASSTEEISVEIWRLIRRKAAETARKNTTDSDRRNAIYLGKKDTYLICALTACSYLRRQQNQHDRNFREITGSDSGASVLEIGIQEIVQNLCSDEAAFEITEVLFIRIKQLWHSAQNLSDSQPGAIIADDIWNSLNQHLSLSSRSEYGQSEATFS